MTQPLPSEVGGELQQLRRRIAELERQNDRLRRLLPVLDASVKEAECERQDFDRDLQQKQKHESLGVLAAGVAQHFNNLLTGILGNTDLVRHTLPPNAPALERLAHIERSAESAAALCQQMLAYAGKGRVVVEPVEVSALVSDSSPLLQMSISSKSALKVFLATGLPGILADLPQMRQALLNLVTNASDALGEREGTITVSTGTQRVDRATLQSAHPGLALADEEYVYIEVSDTGCGMDQAIRERIFDPFFTTKCTGRGLGLSAVLGIVRSHHGLIQVKSAPGEGSSFRLLFPPAGQPAAAAPSGVRTSTSWHGQGTVLVVDDEDQVRQVADALVGSLGFHVIQAQHGREAIAKLAQHPGLVRLVLLDLAMPRLDGEQTLIELHQLAPSVPVVLMSGYSERELSDRFAGKGLAAFLQKPFSREDVRRCLRAALGE